MGMNDHSEVEVRSLDIDVPAWIEQDITLSQVSGILQGGCESGSYMPAVTYHEAMATMTEHGDDILDYIEDAIGSEIWDSIPDHYRSWWGVACYFTSVAVELWASSVESEIEDAISEREDRPVEWSLSDDGTMDTVVSVACRWCGESFDVRYDCETAADYRDESGALDEDAFGEEVIGCDEFECPHCQEYA